MSKPQHLEWVQCRHCGRRQRWKAELAGTEIDCPCGSKIPVPVPDAQSSTLGTGFDADETLVDPELTNEVAAINEGLPRVEQESLLLEEDARTSRGRSRKQRKKGRIDSIGGEGIVNYSGKGPFAGMSRQQSLLFWLGFALLTFAVIVLGAMMVNYWYLGAGGVMFIISLVKGLPAYRLWRGNRSFKRAWIETFASDSEAGSAIVPPPEPELPVEKLDLDANEP